MLGYLIPWLPMIVILAIWIFWMVFGSRRQRSHVREVMDMNKTIISLTQELVTTNREMLIELREIKSALKADRL